ncbi:MAG: heme exporter protein CcmD [Rhizobiaceae bacterium]
MFGAYSAFIVPAYAASALVIAGLIVWARRDHKILMRTIADLEAKGAKRRARGQQNDE